MEVYFDNAATTKVFPEVKDIMAEMLEVNYGNPSSMHKKGMEAEHSIKSAKSILSKILKAESKEIYFTSGGTEANNLALFGAAKANCRSGKHIITTKIEHASVFNPLIQLEEAGYRITFLDVDSQGRINLEQLKHALSPETILVSTIYVNNEIGVRQDIEEISKIIKEYNPSVLYHVDGIQAFGKMNIYPARMGIDLLSISAHKIHGPKGIGALYIKSGTKIKSILFGGGQEKDIRSGTENTSGIAGMGKAAEQLYENLEIHQKKIQDVKDTFIKGVMQIPDVKNNTGEAIHLASISFSGVRSEVLLHALEEKGIYVSAGAACSSNHPSVSGVLKAIGLSDDLLESTLRFGFSVYNTPDEAEYTVKVLKELVPVLRKFRRK